jgi:hypothetical protein
MASRPAPRGCEKHDGPGVWKVVSDPEKLLSLSHLSAEAGSTSLGELQNRLPTNSWGGSSWLISGWLGGSQASVLSCEPPMTSSMPLRDILWNVPFWAALGVAILAGSSDVGHAAAASTEGAIL